MPQRITLKDLTGLNPRDANFVIEYCKDFSARRAAEACGWEPESGHGIRNRKNIATAIERVLTMRLETSDVDAEWLLMEAVDNHLIARQRGNLPASNTALNLVAKHVFVDAFAAEKVEVNSDKEVMDRLLRGRKRLKKKQLNDNKEDISFL